MNYLRKNQKGMTLVEVVIAIAMFSVMTLAVTYAFSAAMKLNARNMRRDRELGNQQAAIERNSTAGIALNDGSTTMGGSTIEFSDGTFTRTISGATEYKAVKSAENGNDFNFELHTISSVPLGTVATRCYPDEGYYTIEVRNNSSSRVDVLLSEEGGRFYEGDYDRDEENEASYVHPSSSYNRALEAKGASAGYNETVDGKTYTFVPEAFTVGFSDTQYDDSSTDISVTVYVRKEGQAAELYGTYTRSSFGSSGKINVVIND